MNVLIGGVNFRRVERDLLVYILAPIRMWKTTPCSHLWQLKKHYTFSNRTLTMNYRSRQMLAVQLAQTTRKSAMLGYCWVRHTAIADFLADPLALSRWHLAIEGKAMVAHRSKHIDQTGASATASGMFLRQMAVTITSRRNFLLKCSSRSSVWCYNHNMPNTDLHAYFDIWSDLRQVRDSALYIIVTLSHWVTIVHSKTILMPSIYPPIYRACDSGHWPLRRSHFELHLDSSRREHLRRFVHLSCLFRFLCWSYLTLRSLRNFRLIYAIHNI